MIEIKRLNMVLGILAVIILVSSSIVFAYTLIPKGDTSKVLVNGTGYAWSEIFGGYFYTVNFEASGRDFTDSFIGVQLSDIVNDTGLSNPSGHEYTLIGSDGYQSTVNWSSMCSGYLVEDGKGITGDKISIFQGLPQRYWVTDVVEIQVV